MNRKQLFTNEEQQEILNIIKGIFQYAKKSPNCLSSEELLLSLLEQSCSKVVGIIEDRKEKEKNQNAISDWEQFYELGIICIIALDYGYSMDINL